MGGVSLLEVFYKVKVQLGALLVAVVWCWEVVAHWRQLIHGVNGSVVGCKVALQRHIVQRFDCRPFAKRSGPLRELSELEGDFLAERAQPQSGHQN